MNKVFASIGACALISALGTVVLIPELRLWATVNILWWVFFVLASGIAIGAGNPSMPASPRVFVALIPSAVIAIYIVFRVFVLQQDLGLSGFTSKDRQFWFVAGFIMLVSWPFTFVFSFTKDFVASIIRFIVGQDSESKVQRASKTITALTGLIGVIALFLKYVGALSS